MDVDAELNRIFAEDDLGLFDVKPKVSNVKSADQRLIDSFEEINNFFSEHGCEPTMAGPVTEQKLACRLAGLRNNAAKSAALSEYDRFNLLAEPPKVYSSIDDILADDDNMGLLDIDTPANNIFSLTNVKAVALPDYIAHRKPCRDFVRFESLFKQCQSDISSGRRHILPFRNASQISKGQFFVLSGVLLYVEEIGELQKNANSDMNGRTRCIFENGTESDMLLRSLSSGLYKDGRRVTEIEERLLDGLKDLQGDDEETGCIYILKSLSKDPAIKSIENLYKIGFTAEPVNVRIKNAEHEPTYLMAPVEVVDVFRCFNLNPQKLESILHTFFGNSCLNMDIYDEKGNRHIPREWFIAPYEVIYQAIHFILNGEIVQYRYDNKKQEIVEK